MNRVSTLRAAVAGLLLLASAFASAADKVKLRLDWVFGPEHAPIFLARDKGYFRDEGIDVEVMPGEGSSVTVKLVGNRDTDFGYATADQALIGLSKDLPIVSTAVITQVNPTALIFKSSKPIRDLKTDLYGKTIGVQLKSNTGRQWTALKARLGLDASRFKEVPADGALVPLLATDRIDVGIGFYNNDGMRLRAMGENMSWILFEDFGVRMYSSSLITNAELIKEKPDLVRRFTRAFVKGWTDSVANPGEAMKAYFKAFPNGDVKVAEAKLPEYLKLTQANGADKAGIGTSTAAGWADMQKTLLEMGMLDRPVDVSKAYTNAFLK